MCTAGTDVISEQNRENIQKKYYSPKKIGINGEKYCYHESESRVICLIVLDSEFETG